jgi:hypothetical protein
VEEPSELMAETLFYQERQIHPNSNSSLIRKQGPSRVGNTRKDQLISKHQANQLTCRSGTPTHNGGKLSKLKEKTLSTLEVKSLMLLEESIMKTKTSSLPLEITR